MNEPREDQYFEGRIRGLEIVRNALIRVITGLQPDLPNEVDLRIRVSGAIENVIAEFFTAPRIIETPFGQGVRDALAESKSEFFSELFVIHNASPSSLVLYQHPRYRRRFLNIHAALHESTKRPRPSRYVGGPKLGPV